MKHKQHTYKDADYIGKTSWHQEDHPGPKLIAPGMPIQVQFIIERPVETGETSPAGDIMDNKFGNLWWAVSGPLRTVICTDGLPQ